VIASCPVCGSRRLTRSFRTPHLAVQRCRVCKHRIADHLLLTPSSVDYHEQYDQGEFLASLAATRRRQAAIILRLIGKQLATADGLVDFGAGRGWFLEACREAGLRSLAGVDTSELAVRSLADRHFGATVVSASTTDYAAALRDLPFRPRILTLLDVVEHFTPDRLRPTMASILLGLQPGLELVVIKVPDAGGLLYRTARLLLGAGAEAPIEQLYQVGTDPPHWNYFSRRSMCRFLESMGLVVLATRGDRDFEASSLAQRARALAGKPALGRVVGSLAAGLADLTGWQDATIYVVAPAAPL
jgi:hypothetical protein